MTWVLSPRTKAGLESKACIELESPVYKDPTDPSRDPSWIGKMMENWEGYLHF